MLFVYFDVYRSGLHDACVEACEQVISPAPTSRAQQAHLDLLTTPAASAASMSVSTSADVNSGSYMKAGANVSAGATAGLPTWSMQRDDAFSLCMKLRCSATEPTKYNPEVCDVLSVNRIYSSGIRKGLNVFSFV